MANTQTEAKGLYSVREISRMTNDALDELLEFYGDTGNVVGYRRVEDEIDARAYDESDPASYANSQEG